MAIITNTQSFKTNSGLYLKFGTFKTATNPWGDYVAFGQNRVIEGVVDLTQVTAGNTLIVSDTTFFPSLPTGQLFIEAAEMVVETALVGGTSFSFGLVDSDRATVPATYGTAFINAQVLTGFALAGSRVYYTGGTNATTSAGSLLGAAAAVQTPIVPDLQNGFYLTVTSAGTYSAGKVRLRVFYHALDVAITQ